MALAPLLKKTLAVAAVALGLSGPALADGTSAGDAFSLDTYNFSSGGKAIYRPTWMHSDVRDAWARGYRGQGSVVSVIDRYQSGSRIFGNLGLGFKALRHGEWTKMQVGMIAPSALMTEQDFSETQTVRLYSRYLNVLNLSYGFVGPAGYPADMIPWEDREASIIDYATNGTAVIVKAAGNDSVAVGAVTGTGRFDYLNQALMGTQAIFVGALTTYGIPDDPAVLANYSNFAGANPLIQDRYLSVLVQDYVTGLAGTSFAAPIVSGYAAIVGSKFRGATPNQVADQLLDTARTDTILGYTPSMHGRGEASLSRALAPATIN